MPSNVVLGADRLPITVVGAWTLEKHERLVKYVDITRAVRRKFTPTETTYIELFCGPGRSIIRGTRKIIGGSPIRAARTAKESGVPYTNIHLADLNKIFVEAVCERMPDGVGKVYRYFGKAESTVDQIFKNLNKEGLHFAFLDPYKLELPFVILEKLAKVNRMDMLVHVSIQDFQRNLDRYVREQDGPLDRFAPGWRKVVNKRDTGRNIRIAIFNHWLGLIRSKLNMAASEGEEIATVVGSKRQPLYWLVLVARHPLAHKFWKQIRNISKQGELFR
jgi:three-Cys-motif partner protein